MTALNNLIQFAERLDGELLADFQQRVNAYMDERDRLQNERIGQSMARLGTFEVVAVAGTAEKLLSDVINVGDTVELNPNVEPTESDMEYLTEDKDFIKSLNTVTDKATFSDGVNIKINKDSYWHRADLFRKVSTPIVNPLNTVEGC